MNYNRSTLANCGSINNEIKTKQICLTDYKYREKNKIKKRR